MFQEFLVQMIHQEKTEAERLLAATPGSKESLAMSKTILADPRIFLRKWVGEVWMQVTFIHLEKKKYF